MWLYHKLKELFFPLETVAVAATREGLNQPVAGEGIALFVIKLIKAFGYSLVYFFFLGFVFYFIFAPLWDKFKKVYKNHGLFGCIEYGYKSIRFLVAYIVLVILNLWRNVKHWCCKVCGKINKHLDRFPRLKSWIVSVSVLAVSSVAFLFTIWLMSSIPATRYFIYHTEPPKQVEIIEYRYIEVPTVIPCTCCSCNPCECDQNIEALTFHPTITLSDEDRWLAEAIVCGEAGNQSYLGQQLVAQCLWDAMVTDNLSLKEVRSAFGYEGYLPLENWSGAQDWQIQSIKDAVSSIFDREEFPVADNILYFYSTANGIRPNVWHETSARFVVEEGAHRFFARK